ncbi:MAG: hypothetical protein ABSD31_13550 [Candidatus Binataceae bacterium]|jgi:integrase
MPTIVKTFRFTDGLCDVKLDYQDYGTFRDRVVRQLLYRVGPRRASFYFHHDTHVHGHRVVTSKLLGHFERGVFGVKEARREAEKIAGRLASVGPESKQRLDEAFAEHVARLRRTRSPKWAEIVQGIGRNHILPKFGRWRLDKLARSPRVIREWHQALTRDAGPVAANHAAKVLRAAYMGAAREDTSLPRDRHPCTSVEYNVEEPRQVGITDWRGWRKAWDKIPNPTRKAYHLFALLCGARPGEAARVRWDGLNAKRRTLTIKKSKSGLDVTIPSSRA